MEAQGGCRGVQSLLPGHRGEAGDRLSLLAKGHSQTLMQEAPLSFLAPPTSPSHPDRGCMWLSAFLDKATCLCPDPQDFLCTCSATQVGGGVA